MSESMARCESGILWSFRLSVIVRGMNIANLFFVVKGCFGLFVALVIYACVVLAVYFIPWR